MQLYANKKSLIPFNIFLKNVEMVLNYIIKNGDFSKHTEYFEKI